MGQTSFEELKAAVLKVMSTKVGGLYMAVAQDSLAALLYADGVYVEPLDIGLAVSELAGSGAIIGCRLRGAAAWRRATATDQAAANVIRVEEILREAGYRIGSAFRAGAIGSSIYAWVGPGPVILIQRFKAGGFEVYAPIVDSNDVDTTLKALRARLAPPAVSSAERVAWRTLADALVAGKVVTSADVETQPGPNLSNGHAILNGIRRWGALNAAAVAALGGPVREYRDAYDQELAAWRQLCARLELVGAVTAEDLASPVTLNETHGQRLLNLIRAWGAAAEPPEAAVCANCGRAQEPTSSCCGHPRFT